MRILVTGANGQLGNEMQVLAKENPQHTYYFTDVQELDICDKQAVWAYIAEKRIELIVNCAAYTAVDKAEDNPELAYKLNCEAAKELASAAQFNGAAMIQVSTDYVFDGTAHIPYTEDCDPCPDSVYGTTKLEGEQEVMDHCEKAVVIRTAWLYSTFGNNFVKTMIRLGKERDSLGVVFDQIGTPTYANDLAQAIYTIINKGIVRGIYHFSNEGVCSWYDFTVAIHRLARITSCKVKPLHTAEYPAKANRPAYSVLDKTKIKTLKNNQHREAEKDKYKVLNVNLNTEMDVFIEKLKELRQILIDESEKIEVPYDISLYKASNEKIDPDGFDKFSVNPFETLDNLEKTSTSKETYLYKINVPENTKLVFYSNITFFENNNQTLPLGMDISQEGLINMDKYKLELKGKDEFNINIFKNEFDNFVKNVKVYEYNLTSK